MHTVCSDDIAIHFVYRFQEITKSYNFGNLDIFKTSTINLKNQAENLSQTTVILTLDAAVKINIAACLVQGPNKKARVPPCQCIRVQSKQELKLSWM